MNWHIFIITHGPIIDAYYNDPLFSTENFTFFNISETNIKYSKYKIINKNEIEDFIALGKWYAEGEVIYNIFKKKLYINFDYIGFLHWDYELKSKYPFINNSVIQYIKGYLANNEDFISFESILFSMDFNQKMMMDLDCPNKLVGDGNNCYFEIIKDYNEFYNKNLTIEQILTKNVNICSAFLIKKDIFEDLMPFYSSVIESGKLNYFDTDHRYRYQGGMLERYIALFSHKYNIVDLPLFHHSTNVSVDIPKSKAIRLIQLSKKYVKQCLKIIKS